MVWYIIGVYIINRILHGRLEIPNFSSRVETNISLVRAIFFDTRKEISYIQAVMKHPPDLVSLKSIDISLEVTWFGFLVISNPLFEL